MAKGKVQITNLTYTKRFNIGDYQHQEYGVAGVVEGDVVEAFAQMKGAVEAAHSAEEIPWGGTSVVDKADVGSTVSKPAKKAAKKTKAKAEPEEVEEEIEEEEDLLEEDHTGEADEEEAEEEGEEQEDGEEEDSEEEEPETKSTKGSKNSKKAPAKKAFKKKGSVYSREDPTHKSLFIETMNEMLGAGWVKSNAGRAKTVSIKMAGKDFLDAEGEVLESFKVAAKKIAKAK